MTFSPDSLIKLGLGSPQNYFKILKATVTPANQAGNVTIGASNDEVSVTTQAVNPATGVVTLLVTAASATPVTAATAGGVPDCNIVGFDSVNFGYTEPLASVPVLVLKPTYCNELSPPNITEENEYFEYGDTVYWLPVGTIKGGTQYATTCWTDVQIMIYDQFNNQLDSTYDGHLIVHEDMSGTGNPPSGAIAHPDGMLSGGMILDEVRDSNREYEPDDPKIDKKWDTYDYTGFNGYDNAISAQLVNGGITSSPFTIYQTLSVSGYQLSPTWIRQYTIYARNHKQGLPMSNVTETSASGT